MPSHGVIMLATTKQSLLVFTFFAGLVRGFPLGGRINIRIAPPPPPTTTTIFGMTSNADNTANNGLFLFDFDGVVCDSCDECTVSALRTCQRIGVFKDHEDWQNFKSPPQWLFEKMREIRPAIEVGWQIPVLLSVFLEQQQKQDAVSVPDIIQNYQAFVDDWLLRNSKTEKDMIDTFGEVRDDWIQNDLTSWLDINTFYSGIPEAINVCKGTAVLVTTKQQRFAIALCRHAGVSEEALPDDKIYGLGQYKNKADVIVDRMTSGKSKYDPQSTHFFEDRWPTLEKCLKDPRLDGVNLYLCEWGYVAKWELELAKAEPRVKVLTLQDFSKIVASL
jgi:phosphoglycolate phosphatase-like HAD superfamily hydrolase